jgi:uncharacterized LabA/DUF88 family protein
MSMYLFVDAGYFRRVFDECLAPFLGTTVEIHWPSVKRHFRAERVFYYDCVDDVLRPGESRPDLHARVSRQEHQLESIGSLDGYFLRLGTIRGNPGRIRQKEVDVLIAVDMLTHSHRGNMTHAILLAGDLDFKPVVEAIVEQGTTVTVAYESRSGSKILARAADSERCLTLSSLWYMSTGPHHPATVDLFPLGHDQKYSHNAPREKAGTIDSKPVYLSKRGERWFIDLYEYDENLEYVYWSSPSEARLFAFIEQEVGPIIWSA